MAGVLGLLAAVGLGLPYTGSSYGHGDAGAFAFLAGMALAPAGQALSRGLQPTWLYQGLPLAAVAAVVGLFAWAK